MTQMAALSFVQEPAQHTRQFVARDDFQVSPIQQLTIPTQQAPFQADAFHAGHGGCQGCRDWDAGVAEGVVPCLLITCAPWGPHQQLPATLSCTAGTMHSHSLDKEGYNRHKIPITPIHTNGIIIGMFVSPVDLTWKTDTCPSSAHSGR
jgi:hypothetical protein